MSLLKKGAMFGLDARIALAIFGALSVISGAALYSAIQQAKAEQLRQYLVEIVKATEAYYLDNGELLKTAETVTHTLNTAGLSSNTDNLSTWRGPYIQTKEAYGNYFFDSTTASINATSNTRIYLRNGTTWTEMNDANSDELCAVGSSDCNEWVSISAGNSSSTSYLRSMFEKLDEMVDSSDGELSGRVRYNTYSSDVLMYKGMPHKRTS
jgi:type II secretory pathway pseudopilin PulG